MKKRNYTLDRRVATAALAVLLVMSVGKHAYGQSPGGVSTNLKLWLKGNAGVSGTTTVTAWADQSGNSNNASAVNVGTAATAPALNATSMNFNPAVTFSGANGTSYKYLKTAANPVTTTLSLIAVYKSTQSAGSTLITTSPAILGADVTTVTNDYGLGFTGGKLAIKADSATSVVTGCGNATETYDGNTFEVTNATVTNTGLPAIGIATRQPGSNTTVQTGNCIVILGTYYGPAADGTVALYSNGTSVGTATTRSAAALSAPTGLGIGNGSSGATAQQFAGDIAEAIAYSGVISATDRQKIESYLAIKYGISLPASYNYLSSAGTTIYTTGTTYSNNIAGIGRDDNSGLNQKQSKTNNTGTQIIMSLGTVATDNASNANTFSADANFLIWGDDNATGNTAIAAPSTLSTRTTKWYTAQNTGVGKTTTIYIPVSYFTTTNSHYLVTNTSASVTGATYTEVPTTTTTINGSSYYSVSYTWTASSTTFFTFGDGTVAAGGISGLTSWFKADAGTNTTTNGAAVSSWTNQVTNANVTSLTETDANRQPTYKTTLWNFNPAIAFDGLAGTNGDVLYNNAIGSVNNVFSAANNNQFFGVFDIEGTNGSSTADPVYFQVSGGGLAGNAKFGLEGHDFLYPLGSNKALNGTAPIVFPSTTPSIVNAYTVPSTASYSVDGGTAVTGTYTGSLNTNVTTNPTYMIGGFVLSGAPNDFFMRGNFTEVLTYNVALTTAQQQQVTSYLAIKYGKTLPYNYLNTSGATTYQITGYANNIAGIGRDDQTVLYQKQSKSINSGNQVIMSIGTPTTTNQLNTSTFAGDKQFLVWGDNGGAETIIADANGATPRRMTKWFKARNTAFTQSVKVMYPASAFSGYNGVYLITNNSTNGAVTTGSSLTPMTTTTFNGVSYYVADYTFPTSATTYFTFGTAANVYYVKTGTADISVAANWTIDSSGAASTAPANFTTAANLFIINNSVGGSNTTTLANPLTISGTDAKLFVMNYNTGAPSISISPAGRLTVGTGAIVNLNGMNVTVRSTAAGTGSIGQTTGTLALATNVTVERYIAAGRKWHLLGAPISSTQTIYNAWQEGGVNTNTGYGTYITNGTFAGGSGYDPAPSDVGNAPTSSLKIFSGAANSTTATPANTNATAINANAGYFIFVRGDRTAANYSAAQAQPTTLRMTGTLNQGAFNQTLSAAGAGFDVLYNPYASPVSLAAATNPPATIYLWDPNYGGTNGGYVLYTRSGNAGSYVYSTSATGTTYGSPLPALQSGQAFLAARAGANTFTLAEAQKTTTSLNLLKTTNLPTGVTAGIVVRLQSLDGSVLKERDVTDARFDATSSNSMVYGEDVPKSGNFGENLSFFTGGEWLAIEKRQTPASGDTLKLQLWKTSAIQYTFEIEAGGLAPGVQPYLVDNYAHTQSPLNPTGTVTYSFTSNGNNVDLNRFSIIFNNAVTLPITITDITANKQAEAVNIDWTVINEDDLSGYEVERSLDGKTFSSFATAKATNDIAEHRYTATDKQPSSGINYYRVKSLGLNGLVKYSRIVTIGFGNASGADINVFPAPVKGTSVNLSCINLPQGSYTAAVYSADGRLITSQKVNITINGTVSQVLDLPKQRPAGIYLLKVEGAAVNLSKKISVE